jgi:dihydrofolate synthase/folylpolyglutamate synthase
LTAWSSVLAALGDKDLDGMLCTLDGSVAEVIDTENSSPRRMPAAALAVRAAELLGAERVTLEPELPQALRTELRLARTVGRGRTAVLVTCSVVTAGEASALLRSETAT